MNDFLGLAASTLLGQAESLSDPSWRVRWEWHFPLWATVLMAVLAVLWIAAVYAREVSPAGKRVRTALALLRMTALLIAVLMFAQPAMEWFRFVRPRLVVLIDRSASMGTADVFLSDEGNELSRLDAVKRLLFGDKEPLFDRLASEYQLDVVAFDKERSLLSSPNAALAESIRSLDTAEEGTDLGGAIRYALRDLSGRVPAAVVVFSDGVTTQGPSLEEVVHGARGLQVPIYSVAVGSEHRRPDIAIENLVVEELVFPGDRLQVEATLRATGFAGRTATLKLSESETGTVLAQTKVELPADGEEALVRLALRPTEPGELVLKLTVEPFEEEANKENNTARQVIEVSDKKIRTLLIQASPSYEYRALKSLLERDPAIDLHVFLQEADADFAKVEETALVECPADEQELLEYDVLIVGDVDPALLPSRVWPMFERFVSEQGGGMACIAGPRFMPVAYQNVPSLQILLPGEYVGVGPTFVGSKASQTYAIEPTTLGRGVPSLQLGSTETESNNIWRGLPAVDWLLEEVRPKSGALVLATGKSGDGKTLPVILRQYVGAGEVLFHATDETWRWRWQTDDRYFARYWGQAVRRLGRGRLAAGRQGIQLMTDRSLYKPGDTVRLQVRFRNPAQAIHDEVVVELLGANGTRQNVELSRRTGRRGVFEAVVKNLLPDEYKARIFDLEAKVARFELEQPTRELARVAVDLPALQSVAEKSGGRVYNLDTATALLDDLPSPEQTMTDTQPLRKLWNSHWMVGLFVLCVTTEWLLRRRYGML